MLSYANPVYSSKDGSCIDALITFENELVLPFTASTNDPEPHGREIHAQIVANSGNVPIGPYAAPVTAAKSRGPATTVSSASGA